MANKLNAFLASVPANGLPSPILKGSVAPTLKAPAFPELSLKAPEASDAGKAAPTPRRSDGIRAVQPATPQPQKQRRHASRRNNKNFERHFSTSDSARNISFPTGNEKNRVGNGDGDGNDDTGDSVDNGSSNQEEIEQHKQQQQMMTPLKAFNPKQQQQKTVNGDSKQQQQLIPNESEAGPLRRLSAQGSHHRRVSTDTTMFNRYLRQQADRDINMDVVQHFSGVPVVTISRSAAGFVAAAGGSASSAAFDTECNSELNNNDEDTIANNNSSISECCNIDPNAILAVFRRGGAISTASALEILKQATNLMSLEQNVISVQAPYTLVGDLHGQFQDLLEIFQVHGVPSQKNPFLFLGDYVDRGISSCEIVLLLLAFKVTFPSSVHMLRGNHECRSLSTFYGFRAECLKKYGTLVYNRMVKCFESMPLAAKLETSYGTFLAVHGGLSPEIGHVEDINEQVNRFMEPEPNGALCDLLWSDPAKESTSQDEEWMPNSVRGCSFTFNERACREFLKRNELLAIIRAHEVGIWIGVELFVVTYALVGPNSLCLLVVCMQLEEDGFREHFNASQREEKSSSDAAGAVEEDSESRKLAIMKLPPVITVFSAPEYCNTNHNMGATLMVPWEKRANVLEFRQHKRSVHREHEFELPSEDQAVKDFLKETLPFLPVDFYELIIHCRQLKQMLILSGQSSSMSLLPLPAMGFGTLPLAESSGGGHMGKSAFALEIGAVTRRPSDAATNKSQISESEDHQARSGHSTTEEHSAVDREETEEDALSTELGRLSSSSRQKRRKQQQKSKQDVPEAQVAAAAKTSAPVAVQSPLGNVQVLIRPPPASSAVHHVKSPPRGNRPIFGGWKLCPGFLRFCDRVFGSKTNRPTDTQSSVPAVALETGDSEDLADNNSRRTSLTTEPMNNQLNSSEEPGSPVATVSPISSLSTLSSTGAQVPPLAQQSHAATDSAVPMQLESLFPGHKPNGSEVFSKLEWQALKLYFTLLDVSGNGVLMEESFVVLLAEQDSDAYATEDELTLLMEVIDTNADGLITEQDFLLFAYRSYLRWKKSHKKLGLTNVDENELRVPPFFERTHATNGTPMLKKEVKQIAINYTVERVSPFHFAPSQSVFPPQDTNAHTNAHTNALITALHFRNPKQAPSRLPAIIIHREREKEIRRQSMQPNPVKKREGLFRRVTKRFHIHRHHDDRDDDVATAVQPDATAPAAAAAAMSRRHSLAGALPSTANSTTLLPAAVTLKQPVGLLRPQPAAPQPSSTSSTTSSLAQSYRRHSSAPVVSDLQPTTSTTMSMSTGSSSNQLVKSASAHLNVVSEQDANRDEVFDECEYNEDDDVETDDDDVENEENQDWNAKSQQQQLSRSDSSSSKKNKNAINIALGLATAEGLMGHDNEDRMIVEHSENFHLLAVLDGHGGGMVADFVKDRLFPAIERCYDHGFNLQELSDTIDSLDQQAQGKAQQILDYSGACLICVLLYTDEATGLPQTLTLNVGDCRAIMHEARGKGKKDNKGVGPNGKLYALSQDHCESNSKEKARVLASGAVIEYGRIGGVLEPFRSIGDIDMKEREMDGWVIATPEIKKTRLLVGRSTLVLATDGVWGSLVNQKVMAIVRKFANDPQAAADAIVAAAREAGSLDDIAVVVAKV